MKKNDLIKDLADDENPDNYFRVSCFNRHNNQNCYGNVKAIYIRINGVKRIWEPIGLYCEKCNLISLFKDCRKSYK